MFRPLFKHPPVYSYLVALSLKIFGTKPFAVIFVSLVFGCLTIPCVYLLSRSCCSRKVSLLAALLAASDPVSIICSQKIWLSTTLTFFVLLAVYFYIKGVQTHNPALFLWGGCSVGLAGLTKYPGFLTSISVLLSVYFYDRRTLKQPLFLISLFLPILMAVPWIFWNFHVYGGNYIYQFLGEHGFSVSVKSRIFILVLLACFFGAVILAAKRKKAGAEPGFQFKADHIRIIRPSVILFLAYFLLEPLMRGGSFSHFPQTTWFHADFIQEYGCLFYLRKLVEFSLLSVVAYAAFFMKTPEDARFLGWMKMNVIVYFIFYSLYGNYQSRYILMAIPFLMILGAHTWAFVFQKIMFMPQDVLKKLSYILWTGLLIVSLLKTVLININVSFINNMCYF